MRARPSRPTAALRATLSAAAVAAAALLPGTAQAQGMCMPTTLAALIESGGCVLFERLRLTDFGFEFQNYDPALVQVAFYGYRPVGGVSTGFGINFSVGGGALTLPEGADAVSSVLGVRLRATPLDGRQVAGLGAQMYPDGFTLGAAPGWTSGAYLSVARSGIDPDLVQNGRLNIGGEQTSFCRSGGVPVFCVNAFVEQALARPVAATDVVFGMHVSRLPTGGLPAPAPVGPGVALRGGDVQILVTPTAVVPEPSTVMLVAGGVVALGALARRRRATG